jgi:hypothetical protein
VTSLTRSPVATRRWRRSPGAGALGAYLLVDAAMWALVVMSPHRLVKPPLSPELGWLDGWIRYDSNWYHAIATSGYFYMPGQQSSVAFFPTYPMAMRGLGALVGSDHLAGVLVTVASGITIAVLFARWCADRLPRTVSVTALALLLLYPYSLYLYGAVYADALFVATTLGAFLLLERGRPWLAGGVGALATAGRPVGIAVVIGLTVRAVELAAQRRAVEARQLVPATTGASPAWTHPVSRPTAGARTALAAVRWRDAGVLLSGTGLLVYCGYQWLRFDNPFAFVATESAPGWDQGTGLRVWFKVALVDELRASSSLGQLKLLSAALACLVVVLLLPRIRRRFGWGYAAFTAVVVAIPFVTTKDFFGSGRYMLAAFPAFAAAADFLARRPAWVLRTVLVLFAVGLAYGMVLYTRGYEVS